MQKYRFGIGSKIIEAFEGGIFPLSKENLNKKQAEKKKKKEKVGSYKFERIKKGLMTM